MKAAEKAIDIFTQGFNCSQSVIYGFTDTVNVNIDPDAALKIAQGFGGGMGRKQEVCGAISGAVMVLGLVYGRGLNDKTEKREITYLKVQALIDTFKKHHNYINCKELLSGCPLLSEEGRARFKDNRLFEKCCEYIRSACNILEKLILDENHAC